MILRKSSKLMTGADWDVFNSSVEKLFDDGLYEPFVMHHAAMGTNFMARHRMHGSMSGTLGFLRFLPWHRAYLLVFERALKKVNSEAFIPYWDWTKDTSVPSGIISLPNNNRHSRTVDFVIKTDLETIKANDEFYWFTRELEVGPHNRGHNFVGGIMGNPMFSPRDPLFWLHHANVDRIWNEWQNMSGNGNKVGDFSGFNQNEKLLDPWDAEFNTNNINHINNLGDDSYAYGPRETSA